MGEDGGGLEKRGIERQGEQKDRKLHEINAAL